MEDKKKNSKISIKVNELTKTFDKGKVVALNNISLFFEASKLHGIIGSAGAGKTTLLRIMMSLLDKDKGEIEYFLNGEKSDFWDDVRNGVAYMPERQSLYSDLSVLEHLRFFSDMYGIDKFLYKEKSKILLEMTRLDKFLDRPAGKLSGGMYKKLGLMCALLRSPDLIFLDEPTNGVDPISRREFWEILNDATSSGITVIMTTAYMDEAERCGNVHLMEEGNLIGSGEPKELLERENVANFDEFFIKRSRVNAIGT